MLDITSGCKSLFGAAEHEEVQDEVPVLCFSSLNLKFVEFSERSCSLSKHVRKVIREFPSWLSG